MSRIFITGLGVITSLGDSVNKNRIALKEGTCGISRLELFDTRYAGTLPAGEIKIENAAFKNLLNVRQPEVTRTSLLALHAIEEAVQDGGLDPKTISSFDTALIVGNTVGGMCLTDELYNDANKSHNGSPYVSSYDSGSIAIYLQSRYGINGITNTINTACSSSANAIMYGARLIRQGYAKRAIVGGVDSLAKFTINGFNSLHILSEEICKPFDKDRTGLNLGEGAGFLILEREEDIKGKKVYAELTGYANTNDAYHPSSLSDEGNGPYSAMKTALEIAGLQPEQISFINAHGTATENNDQVESRAMQRLFEKPVPFASTKSNIGHTLGASGAIEAVFSILNIKHQEVYKSLNFQNPIERTGYSPVQAYIQMPVEHVMSNSFGFGGNCSSLIFSKV